MDFQEIVLERGACYGRCPVYQVRIRHDGEVEWVGSLFVEEIGSRHWRIDRSQVEALQEVLDRAGFEDLQQSYDQRDVTDHASVTIRVEFGSGEVKEIRHYLGDDSAPAKLAWLENKIDEISGTAPYVGSAS